MNARQAIAAGLVVLGAYFVMDGLRSVAIFARIWLDADEGIAWDTAWLLTRPLLILAGPGAGLIASSRWIARRLEPDDTATSAGSALRVGWVLVGFCFATRGLVELLTHGAALLDADYGTGFARQTTLAIMLSALASGVEAALGVFLVLRSRTLAGGVELEGTASGNGTGSARVLLRVGLLLLGTWLAVEGVAGLTQELATSAAERDALSPMLISYRVQLFKAFARFGVGALMLLNSESLARRALP